MGGGGRVGGEVKISKSWGQYPTLLLACHIHQYLKHLPKSNIDGYDIKN